MMRYILVAMFTPGSRAYWALVNGQTHAKADSEFVDRLYAVAMEPECFSELAETSHDRLSPL